MLRNAVGKILGKFPIIIQYVVPVAKAIKNSLPRKSESPLDPEEREALFRKLENRLKVLYIGTTNICNAKCRFCGSRFVKRSPRIMTSREFMVLLDKYIEYGGGDLNLTPLVGDPLVDKDLTHKIRMARGCAGILQIGFFTNLIGLGSHDVKALLLSGIDWIFVSTCIGDRSMYQRVYGVDKYDLVMTNLDRLLHLNNDLGKPVSVCVSLRGEKPYRQIYASSDYQRVVRLLGTYISVIDDDYSNWAGLVSESDLPSGNTMRVVSHKREPCFQLYHGLQVFLNGDVTLCYCRDIDGELLVGNLYEQTLDGIWRGDAVQQLRKAWNAGDIPEICRKCSTYIPVSKWFSQ